MSWMQYGAHPYDIGTTEMPGVTIRHVAHSAARINRYNGHSLKPLSIARHMVYVSKLLDFDTEIAMHGLLHDVAETVTGDMSYPMKTFLRSIPGGMDGFNQATEAAEVALYKVFGMKLPTPEQAKWVKEADNVAAATERAALMDECPREWSMLSHKPGHVAIKYTKCPYDDAAEFMARYHELATVLGITPGGMD